MPLFGAALAAEVGRGYKAPVQMMQLALCESSPSTGAYAMSGAGEGEGAWPFPVHYNQGAIQQQNGAASDDERSLRIEAYTAERRTYGGWAQTQASEDWRRGGGDGRYAVSARAAERE